MINKAAIVIALAVTAPALAGWSESTQGDISGNKNSPTAISLAQGSNLVQGTIQSGDIDYLTITIPAGLSLAAIPMINYAGEDGIAFIAFQSGTVFTEGPSAASVNVANLLGYTLFGTNVQNLGDDLLLAMQTEGFGSQGFDRPLAAGSYTFWIQQTGALTDYTLDFQVIPAPGAIGVLGLAGLAALRRRR